MDDHHGLILDIEDHLAPRLRLDVGEVRLYYHLLRHSRLMNRHELTTSIPQLCEGMNCSKNTIKPRLRSLEDKGLIAIVNSGWVGTTIRVFLPREVPGAVPVPSEAPTLDIETLDFFADARYRPAIFEREGGRCFYCQRALSTGDYGLDHVEPQVARGGNSYRNVVAACHSCNSSKQGLPAGDFIRLLYRRGFLASQDLEQRLAQLEKLSNGQLRPIVQ